MRSPILYLVAAAILLIYGSSRSVVDNGNTEISSDDAAEIYGKFLDSWTGKEKTQINVSIKANAPSSEDIEQFSDCAHGGKSGGFHWLPTKSVDNVPDSNWQASVYAPRRS